MKNQDLKKRYDQIYKEGEATFFSKFMDNTNISETDAYVLAAAGWEGKSVLDAGCGTGKTAYLISQSGAKQVVGIDFSEEAIKVAKQKFNAPNLYYSCMELHEWRETVDVIVSCGTLEHMDRPWDTFAMMSKLIPAVLLEHPRFCLDGASDLIECSHVSHRCALHLAIRY